MPPDRCDGPAVDGAVVSEQARLRVNRTIRDGASVVSPRGVLDLGTYPRLRDCLFKCAMDQPRALVVDLGALRVPTEPTLSVFSTVSTAVSDWPGVPIALVAEDPTDRQLLRHRVNSHGVPVHATIDEALRRLDRPPPRRRSVLDLPSNSASSAIARWFVGETCLRWGCVDVLPAAIMVATELVENTVRHTRSEPRLRVEWRRERLTVAVYDDDPTPARLISDERLESPRHLGLRLVASVSTAWNCAPLWSGGKVVWAVLRHSEPDSGDAP